MSHLLLHLKNVNLRGVSRVFALSLLLCSLVLVPVFASSDDTVLREPIQDVSTSTLRISANETSGFHAVILGLLGDYNPIVKDYTYQSSSGYTSHSIEITPDWSWIASAAIFLVIIFCLFRLIGGIFSWKR